MQVTYQKAEKKKKTITMPQDRVAGKNMMRYNIRMAKDLTFAEKKFCHEYINNGQNGKQAYLAIKPAVKPTSAETQASTYLSKPKVRDYINSIIDNQYTHKFASKFKLLSESEEVRLASMEEKEYGHAIKAIDLKGKIAGVYAAEQTDLTDYKQIMQSLTINVNTVNVGQTGNNPSVASKTVNTDFSSQDIEPSAYKPSEKNNSLPVEVAVGPPPRLRLRSPLSESLEETMNDDNRRQRRQGDDREDKDDKPY